MCRPVGVDASLAEVDVCARRQERRRLEGTTPSQGFQVGAPADAGAVPHDLDRVL